MLSRSLLLLIIAGILELCSRLLRRSIGVYYSFSFLLFLLSLLEGGEEGIVVMRGIKGI